MRRALRSRSLKKMQVRLPSGKTVIHIKKRRPSAAKCGRCGAKLNRARLRKAQLAKLPKTKKRPERSLPEFCPKCMREVLKERVRA